MSSLSYRTLARDGAAEIEVKRSRFLCTLARVERGEDARALVQRLRQEHWDARHHCSAFVLGPPAALGIEPPVERSSDDGEPAGTAGAPMLDVLRGYDGDGLGDVVAVVTRWFGGTLLGAGGLVRAYSDAVRTALDSVGTRRRDLLREHRLEVGHDIAGKIETELRTAGVTVLGTDYGDAVTLRLAAPLEDEGRLTAMVAELTAGAAAPEPGPQRWFDR